MSVAPPGMQTRVHHEAHVSEPPNAAGEVGQVPTALSQTERIWGGVAFAATAVGSLGPWAKLGVFSQAGTDGDGVISLVLAVVGAILIILNRGAVTRIGVGVVGLVILGVGVVDIADVSGSSVSFLGSEISPSVGWGLWMVTLSGVAAIACPFARRLGIGKHA